ncbi:MAG: hypothetical protein ACLFTA_02935 [Candidatus Nanohaloarchaea archaeon]
MRRTVNLSKLKASPQQERAKKAVSLLRESFEEEVKISRELNEEIWSRGIHNPPTKVTVENEGGTLYPAESFEAGTETEEEEEDEASTDYTDTVSGNISEVKDRVGELEDPDFEALIEAEEDGKDRKTLKEWLESQK